MTPLAIKNPPPFIPALPTWEVVSMDAVPAPPPGAGRSGRYALLYEALRELKPDKALKVRAAGKKELCYMRSQLSGLAKRDNKRVLSSRNTDSTIAWVWLAPLPGKGK